MRRVHDVPVRLSRANPEVDRIGRVPDQDFGWLLRWPTIDRLILRESSEARCSIPHLIIEIAVDVRCRVDSRDIDMDAIGAPVVHERRVLKQSCRDESGEEHHLESIADRLTARTQDDAAIYSFAASAVTQRGTRIELPLVSL